MQDIKYTEQQRVLLAEKVAAFVPMDIGWAREVEHYAFIRYGEVAYQRALKRCVYYLQANIETFQMQLLEDLVAGNLDNIEESTQELEEVEEEVIDDEEGLLQCFHCKSTRIESYQRQTRSADEAMTTFCMCLVCHQRWKQ